MERPALQTITRLWGEVSEEQACLMGMSAEPLEKHLHPYHTEMADVWAPLPQLPLLCLKRTHVTWSGGAGASAFLQLQLGTLGKPSNPDKGWAESLQENGCCLKRL